MKRLSFCFNFWRKKIKYSFLENKKFEKDYFKPSEDILHLKFFRRIIRHSRSNFYRGFEGWNVW